MDNSTEPTFEIVTVTPATATAWLESNSGNRKSRPHNVERLANALRSGEWRLTNDAVTFDEDGLLLNGQHRLLAIGEAGVPAVLAVLRGVPREAREAIDLGARRQVSDLLFMLGHEDARTAGATYRYLHGLRQVWAGKTGTLGGPASFPTPATVRRMAEKEPITDSLSVAHRVRRSPLRLSTGLVAALHHEMAIVNTEQAHHFWESLAYGDNLPARSPILKLRNWLLAEQTGTRRAATVHQAAIIVKAWNYWREGVFVDLLVWKPSLNEKFPDVQGTKAGRPASRSGSPSKAASSRLDP